MSQGSTPRPRSFRGSWWGILCFYCASLRMLILVPPSVWTFLKQLVSFVFPRSVPRKRVRFDRAAEFLAACASGDREEAELMLKETQDGETEPQEHVEIINCTNADGITALHQVRPPSSPGLNRCFLQQHNDEARGCFDR